MVLILVIACHILHFPFSVNYTFTSVKNTKSKRPDPPTSKSVDSLEHSATIVQKKSYWMWKLIKQLPIERKYSFTNGTKGWTFQREFNKYRKEFLEHSYNRLQQMELFCRTLPLQQAATCMLVLETESHLLVIVDSLPAEYNKCWCLSASYLGSCNANSSCCRWMHPTNT